MDEKAKAQARMVRIQLDSDVYKALALVARSQKCTQGEYVEHLLRCDEHIDRVLYARAREHTN